MKLITFDEFMKSGSTFISLYRVYFEIRDCCDENGKKERLVSEGRISSMFACESRLLHIHTPIHGLKRFANS